MATFSRERDIIELIYGLLCGKEFICLEELGLKALKLWRFQAKLLGKGVLFGKEFLSKTSLAVSYGIWNISCLNTATDCLKVCIYQTV